MGDLSSSSFLKGDPKMRHVSRGGPCADHVGLGLEVVEGVASAALDRGPSVQMITTRSGVGSRHSDGYDGAWRAM